MLLEGTVRIQAECLKDFAAQIFGRLGVPWADAQVTAEVLVAADLRGIESHGVQRLGRYVGHLKKGLIQPVAEVRMVQDRTGTLLLDGGNGLGQVVGSRAMELCIEKAEETGAAFVAVRNSNHYGIAGYYAMLALRHDMIGLSFTNARPLVAPTYGREPIIGTNPISIAVPAGRERPFVLDMATSVVPSGKIEMAARKGKRIPLGWAVDNEGLPTQDPEAAFSGGSLLPLGGSAEFAGYKGYGLSVMVDILCGVLSGAAFGRGVEAPVDGREGPSRVGHFFAALQVEAFRPLEEFKRDMDRMIWVLRSSGKAQGETRIFIHGEKEFEAEEARRRLGIPLHQSVYTSLREIGEGVGIELAASGG